MSLLSDVIKGLGYLHRSPITCHGRLTTNTSLVDNRMVVQLSDFGVSMLFADEKLEEYMEPAVFDYHSTKLHFLQETSGMTFDIEIV